MGLPCAATATATAQQQEPEQPDAATPAPVLPPVVPAPGPGMLIVSCDPGGCWDEYGMRYDRADAGVFVRRDGSSCLAVRGRMRCE
ncbi:MAG: hypothetical protein KIT63_13715 [Rhodoferax sp.]|nr:hypothetical protein [Rhodoferax sp.]